MILTILGVTVGILAGIFIPYHIPSTFTAYFGIGLLAAFDTLFGGIKALMLEKFDLRLFLTGFVSNTALAILLTWIGGKVELNLSLAAVVVFGTRMFNNFSLIRQHILQNRRRRVRIKEMGKCVPTLLDDGGQPPQESGRQIENTIKPTEIDNNSFR